MTLSVSVPNGYRICIRYYRDGSLEIAIEPIKR